MEKKISALTPAQVHEAMRRHLDLARLTVVKAGNFAKAAEKAAEKDKPEGK